MCSPPPPFSATNDFMNDYWNDPPEIEEPPECCGDLMDTDEKQGCFVCPTCKKQIEWVIDDIDPSVFADEQLPDDYES